MDSADQAPNKKLFIACGVVTAIFVAGCGSSSVSVPDPEAIHATFEGYQMAILAQDGDKALRYVDTNTVEYYGKMVQAALTGDRETVEGLSVLDKVMVMTLRHRVPHDVVKTMTSESCFIHAVKEGWISKSSVVNNSLGEVAVLGDHATGVHVYSKTASDIKWSFVREQGNWKLDLTSLFPTAMIAFRQVIALSGTSEDEFIFDILEVLSGEKVTDKIWDPIGE